MFVITLFDALRDGSPSNPSLDIKLPRRPILPVFKKQTLKYSHTYIIFRTETLYGNIFQSGLQVAQDAAR